MGSSYVSSLRTGSMPTHEAKLREAVRLVREVVDEWYHFDQDQFDDAADDGGFIAEMGHAIRLIEDNLPDPVGKATRDMTDAMKYIEERKLRVKQDGGGDWQVGDANLMRWGKTIAEALANYRRDLAAKGRK